MVSRASARFAVVWFGSGVSTPVWIRSAGVRWTWVVSGLACRGADWCGTGLRAGWARFGSAGSAKAGYGMVGCGLAMLG